VIFLVKMFKLLLTFALLVSTAFGGLLPPEYTEWEGRIVGGRTASPGQFPFIVSLRTTANSHFCGGSIMNSRWVVSAAHCTIGRSGGNTIVAIGAQHITGGTRVSVSRIINHPNYNSQTLNNDISLVQTASAMGGTGVAVIPLGSTFISGGSARAIGWGQTSHPGSLAANLQFVDKTVITNANCQSRWGTRINNAHLCTSSPVGVGTCMGDSGGPLVQGGQLIGAVSFGSPCARGMPDVYARVSTFRTWLINNAV
jgi:secreted trypsin-like serine protease